MRIEFLLILFLVSSCSSPQCDKEAFATSVNEISEALERWDESLHFLDREVIEESTDYLKCVIADVETCLSIGDSVSMAADSAVRYFVKREMTTADIERGEAWAYKAMQLTMWEISAKALNLQVDISGE